ncbi:MAG TPA: cache domain-containing protein [Candidatus Binatia bacterium]
MHDPEYKTHERPGWAHPAWPLSLQRAILYQARCLRRLASRSWLGAVLTPRLSISSLRVRLSLLVVVAILPCAALVLLNNVEEQHRAIADAEKEALKIARLASSEHRQLLERSRDLLAVLAQFPEQLLGSSSCRDKLAELATKFLAFNNLGVSDRNGKMLCSGSPFPPGVKFNDRPWFIRALETKEFVVSDYLIGRITQMPTLIVAQPVLDRTGQVRAVISASIKLSWLQSLVAAAQLPPRAVAALIDDRGVILARHPDAEKWTGRSAADAGIVKEILSRKSDGTVETQGGDGVSRLYFFTPVTADAAGKLYFYVGFPKDDLLTPIRKTMWRNLVWLAAVLLAGLYIANAWGKLLIVNPLRSLREAAHKLATGDLTARAIVAEGHGEIARLAGSFNEMAAALERQQIEAHKAQKDLKEQAIHLADLGMTLLTTKNKLEAEIAERRRSEQRIHAVYEMTAALNSTLELKQVLDILLEKVERIFRYPSAVTVKLFNKTTGDLEALACRNLDEQEWKELVPGQSAGFAREVIKSRAPVISQNAQTDRRAHRPEFYRKQGIVSYLGLPLLVDQEILGVLGFQPKEEHHFTTDEIDLLTLLANEAAVAIHNAQLHEEIRAGHRRLMELSRNLLQAQENERKLVATEIHDEIGQTLTALKLSLEMMPNLPPHKARMHLSDSLGLVIQTIAQIRALLQNLRPPMLDHLGLLPTLEWHFKRYSAQTNVQVKFNCNGSPPRLDPDVEIAAYRIVQEALNNVARHAGVKQAKVSLDYDGQTLTVKIDDRGKGFIPEKVLSRAAGCGLSGMIERAAALGGRCSIQSVSGKGTRVQVDLPVESRRAVKSA